jgi:hypothetical protein
MNGNWRVSTSCWSLQIRNHIDPISTQIHLKHANNPYKSILYLLRVKCFLCNHSSVISKSLWTVSCWEQTSYDTCGATRGPSRYATHKCITNIWNCCERGSLIFASTWGKGTASFHKGIMPVYKWKLIILSFPEPMQLPSLQKSALSVSSKTLSDKFEKIKYLATTYGLQGNSLQLRSLHLFSQRDWQSCNI